MVIPIFPQALLFILLRSKGVNFKKCITAITLCVINLPLFKVKKADFTLIINLKKGKFVCYYVV